MSTKFTKKTPDTTIHGLKRQRINLLLFLDLTSISVKVLIFHTAMCFITASMFGRFHLYNLKPGLSYQDCVQIFIHLTQISVEEFVFLDRPVNLKGSKPCRPRSLYVGPLRPIQQFISHIGTMSCLPGMNQYYARIWNTCPKSIQLFFFFFFSGGGRGGGCGG